MNLSSEAFKISILENNFIRSRIRYIRWVWWHLPNQFLFLISSGNSRRSGITVDTTFKKYSERFSLTGLIIFFFVLSFSFSLKEEAPTWSLCMFELSLDWVWVFLHYSDVNKCFTGITMPSFIQGGIGLGAKFHQEGAILANKTFLMTKKIQCWKSHSAFLSQLPATWKSKVRKCRLEIFLLPSLYHMQSMSATSHPVTGVYVNLNSAVHI